MIIRFMRRFGTLTLLLICHLFLQHETLKASVFSHDEAIKLARAGNYRKAIDLLESLQKESPEDLRITEDLIVIYSWDNQPEQAVSLYEESAATLKSYTHKAALESYRKLNQPEKAIKIVDDLLALEKDKIDLLRIKVVLLVEQLQFEAARQLLENIALKTGKDLDYYKQSAEIFASEDKWVKALAEYQRIQSLGSENTTIQEQFAALRHLRAAQAANGIFEQNRALFDKKDQALLLLNKAAEKLRWSTDASINFAETEILAMEALAKQLIAFELLDEETQQSKWSFPIIHDIVVTLRNLRRMDDVEAIYNHLKKIDNVPRYVADATAGAILAIRKPDISKELYSELLEYSPNAYQQQIGLFYSHVELEDFDEAYELIDRMHEKEPIYQNTKSKAQPYPNDRYLNLDVFSLLARFYADQLETSWSRANQLVKNAPVNNWLWEVRGQIANARQWHHQALYDFHYAHLLEPESLNAITGKAMSLIALGRFEEAREPLTIAVENYPREHGTKDLLKQWKFARKPHYFGDIVWSRSSGPEIDGESIVATAQLLSSPLYDHMYIVGLYRYAWAELLEGEETFERRSIGAEYQVPNLRFKVNLTDNYSNVEKKGGNASVTWTPDDFWRINLFGEIFSVDTPLRALYHGIRSDKVQASMNYRWSEQRGLSVNLGHSWFTDNNKRLEAGAVFSQRLIDIPHYDLDARLETSASSNSREEALYFNPEWDFTLKGALHLDHVYWRSHDHLLAHQFDFGYGNYKQHGFKRKWIGHLRYEQRYKLTPWIEMLAGIEFGRGVYDGQPEHYRLIRLMITGKI